MHLKSEEEEVPNEQGERGRAREGEERGEPLEGVERGHKSPERNRTEPNRIR